MGQIIMDQIVNEGSVDVYDCMLRLKAWGSEGKGILNLFVCKESKGD